MDSKTYDDKILETYVNRCIDNVVKYELIEGVTDVNSFAEFAFPLEFEDDRLAEGIRQGAEIAYRELSAQEQKKLESFSCSSLYDKEYPMGGVTRRYYGIEEWSAHLFTLVFKRIKLQLRKEVTV